MHPSRHIGLCTLLIIIFGIINIGYLWWFSWSSHEPLTPIRSRFGDSVQIQNEDLNQLENLNMTTHTTSEPEYLLYTEHCKIPKTAIWPPYFRKHWRIDLIPNCSYEVKLAKISRQILTLLPEYQHKNCCFHKISRMRGEDGLYNLGKCKKVDVSIKTSRAEMYVLQCGSNLNFDANIPIRKNVRRKMTFWKTMMQTQSEAFAPINVLIIGIDTASRSHAYRSMPKTLKYIKDHGFHDFQAYHSIEPSTLTNSMAFLMGLRRMQARELCTPTWNSTFDRCPFIWKNFSTQKYVTLDLENGDQAYNWGGQSGFHDKPTDYYIHPLFNAIEWMRLRQRNQTEDSVAYIRDRFSMFSPHDYCASRETVPEFMLRYLQRFLQTFRKTPFFVYTYFTDPFHNQFYALSTLDVKLRQFFRYMHDADLFKNTLVVLLSDHGIRHASSAFYEKNSFEAYVERGLPQFFIRVPERLRNMYPKMNLDRVMGKNAKELTSPFDLHHTLLDLLSLTGLHSDPKRFNPVMPDRASLFTPIKNVRTPRDCAALNIAPHACVCNVIMTGEPFASPYYRGRITAALEEKLEGYLSKGNYTELCADWIVWNQNLVSTSVVNRKKSSTVYLIIFSAYPEYVHSDQIAMFEAMVRVIHQNSTFDNCQVIGDLNRINAYGDTSSCIPSQTDEDKKLKGYCVCKTKLIEPKNRF